MSTPMRFLLLLAASLPVLPSFPAQTQRITFEEQGIVAMSNAPGTVVPAAARVSDRYLATHAISFRTAGGFVAVVHHGAATPSPPNIIGGTSAAGALDYREPVTIRFHDPVDPTQPGVTDFVRVRGDLSPLGTGTVTLRAFAVDDTLLGTVVVPDVSPGAVLSASFTAPGIHRVVITQTSATVGLDDVEFTTPRRAATYVAFGNGCAGSLGVPVLGAVPGSLPLPGTTFAAQIAGAPAGVALMIMGFSTTQSGPFSLPLALDPFGLPGCQLFAEALATQFVVGPHTTIAWPIALPAGPALLGTRFVNQGLVLDTTANAAGFVLSNAAAATIGS